MISLGALDVEMTTVLDLIIEELDQRVAGVLALSQVDLMALRLADLMAPDQILEDLDQRVDVLRHSTRLLVEIVARRGDLRRRLA